MHLINNDEDMTKSKEFEALEGIGEPITKARIRRVKKILQQVLITFTKIEPSLEESKFTLLSHD